MDSPSTKAQTNPTRRGWCTPQKASTSNSIGDMNTDATMPNTYDVHYYTTAAGNVVQFAALTGGEYFRARSQEELSAVARTLDRLQPVAQAPTTVYRIEPLYAWPLGAAVLLSLLLVLHELWPQWPPQFRRRRP